jgi:hypothetical protein
LMTLASEGMNAVQTVSLHTSARSKIDATNGSQLWVGCALLARKRQSLLVFTSISAAARAGASRTSSTAISHMLLSQLLSAWHNERHRGKNKVQVKCGTG